MARCPGPWIDPDKALPWVEKHIGLSLAKTQIAAIRLEGAVRRVRTGVWSGVLLAVFTIRVAAMVERYPRASAYHEAGHVTVAWSLGLPIGAVSVSADDGSGNTQIGLADQLTLIEQIAVCYGGVAAVEFFGHSIHRHAGFNDHVMIKDLLEKHGVPEDGQGRALRDEGYNVARTWIETHQGKVTALAELLVEHGRIEASEIMLLMQT